MNTEKRPETENRPNITRGQIARWSLPFVISLAVMVITISLGWTPWFGYAAVIAGALGSLMYVGRSLGVGEG